MTTKRCGYCKGTGIREGFMHRDNGRCWHCMGAGRLEYKPREVKQYGPSNDEINELLAKLYPNSSGAGR